MDFKYKITKKELQKGNCKKFNRPLSRKGNCQKFISTKHEFMTKKWQQKGQKKKEFKINREIKRLVGCYTMCGCYRMCGKQNRSGHAKKTRRLLYVHQWKKLDHVTTKKVISTGLKVESMCGRREKEIDSSLRASASRGQSWSLKRSIVEKGIRRACY
jgi:hypothetical protein